MKTIKQKLLHSKLAVLGVLLFAFILLVSGGVMTRKASAEETFSADNFVMCNGAEVRTDGINGIRFVASLGDVLPKETDYANLTYNVMIVPKVYMTHYNITENYYKALESALNADSNVTDKFIATMETEPFYSDEVVAGEEGYYIRGTLSNVQYKNINVDWFGMAYLTYTDAKGETQYIYAQIPEAGANVRSLVYCASGYLNVYDYSNPDKAQEKEILTNFVAQGINKKAGVVEASKNDKTKLNESVATLVQSASEQVNLLPNATATWAVPAGMHVVYDAEDKAYASINENGVIMGVEGDGVKSTTKNVTMKVFGTTYTRPVHVYKVTAELPETITISSKGGTIGDTEFTNSVTLPTAQVDGEDVEDLDWTNDKESVATVSEGVVTAVEQNEFFADSKTANVSYSFDFAGETFTSNACTVQVSFPVAYKTAPLAYDLIQNVFVKDGEKNEVVALETTTEDIKMDKLTGFTGTVAQFFEKNTNKSVLTKDGKTNANVYGAKEAGEKEFIVVSTDGYAYAVKATVVSYEIKTEAQLYTFFQSYVGATTDDESNVTAGTYVTLGADFAYAQAHSVHASANSALTYYKGVFDGRGHSITFGLSTGYRLGLFGNYLGTGGVIKNTAFINLSKYASTGGGLAKALQAGSVVDNCYVEINMIGATAKEGGVCYINRGTIANTIVHVFATTTTGDTTKGTLCYQGDASSNTDFDTCFSIGKTNKVIYSAAAAEKEGNLAFGADGLKKLIGESLPTSYGSHWTYTETELKFGNTTLLTFTA